MLGQAMDELNARCDDRPLDFLRHLESQAKELCPDYPWKRDDAFEHLWALTSALQGTEMACDDWAVRCELLEDVLRETASALGVGGYNTQTVEPEVYRQKIRDGLDLLVRPWVERAEKAEKESNDVKRFFESVRTHTRNRNPEGCTVLDFMAVWNEQYDKTNQRLKSLIREACDLLRKGSFGDNREDLVRDLIRRLEEE